MFSERKDCFAVLRNRHIYCFCQLSSLKTKRKQITGDCMKVSEQVAPTAQQSKPLQLCQLLLAKCPILKITENCYYYYYFNIVCILVHKIHFSALIPQTHSSLQSFSPFLCLTLSKEYHGEHYYFLRYLFFFTLFYFTSFNIQSTC